MLLSLDDWIEIVKKILIKNRWIKKEDTLCRRSWKSLYDDGLNPMKAVAVNMECEGVFTLEV